MCSYYNLFILLLQLSEVLAIGTREGILLTCRRALPILQVLLCFLTPRILEDNLLPFLAQPWNQPCL